MVSRVKNMKKRVLSALVMAVICIPLIIIGGIPFRIAVGILGILAYKEILDLKGIKEYPKVVVAIGLLVMLLLIFSNRDIFYMGIGLDYRYIAAAFIAMFIPTLFYFDSKKYTIKDAFLLTSFIMFVGISFNLVSNVLIYEKPYFFLIILVTILTDTFAYFTGSAIGKHKVTSISPNKSLEGYIGGILMGTILSAIFYMTFIGNASLWSVIPSLIVMAIVCELGDLFYSAIKREYDIKDFSNLIPGHGGILDRVDSLTFVVMAFILLRSFL